MSEDFNKSPTIWPLDLKSSNAYAQFLRDIEGIANLRKPKSIQDAIDLQRAVGLASTAAMAKFLREAGLAPAHIHGSLTNFAVSLNDLIDGIPHPLFATPPKKTPKDTTSRWSVRGDVAALVLALETQTPPWFADPTYEVFRRLERYLPLLTRRSIDARDRKDRPAKRSNPTGSLRNLVRRFKSGDIANDLALQHFQSQRDWLMGDVASVEKTKRARWLDERVSSIVLKLEVLDQQKNLR